MRGALRTVMVAVDVGTTGARAVAVDLEGRVIREHRRPFPTRTPNPGWTEQDPRDWAERAVESLALLARRLDQRAHVAAIGLTGQCPSVAPFDAQGRPVGPGILYLDNRSATEAAEMRELLGDAEWHRRTGHVPEAFYVGPTMLWLRRHQPGVYAETRRFLQPRDVVLRRLTGVEATDETHAGTTLFYDLEHRRWATDLLDAFNVDPDLLPRILSPTDIAGELTEPVAKEVGLDAGTPVVIGAADSLCAAFGAGVADAGPISEMAGSSSCLNSSVTAPVADPRITLYSHVAGPGYMTELGVNTAGAAMDWVVRRFAFDRHSSLVAEADRFHRRLRRARRRGADPLEIAPLFVPYLGDGERDDPRIRGGFVGLSQRHDRSAIAFATIEGVAFSLHRVLGTLQDAGCRFDELRVSGGAAMHPLTSQIKADVLDRLVVTLDGDTTAIGCALLAASGTEFKADVDHAIGSILNRARRYSPSEWARTIEAERAEWFTSVTTSAALRMPERTASSGTRTP
jgi:xylulokinase